MKPVSKIWMNGELVDWNDAKIHVLSHIVHYGYGVFEGIRCYETHDGGRAIFRLKEHIRRLEESAHILQLDMPWTREQLIEACEQVVAVNNLTNCYIRPTVAVGYGKMGIGAIDNPKMASIAAFEWGAYLGEEGIKNGVSLKVSSYPRMQIHARMLKAKANGMYVNNILAKREAIDNGYDEALMLDGNGYVTEASGENFFIVRDGEVWTPPVTMVLAGITRDASMRILTDMGVKVSERLLARDEVYVADEAFMTGTAAEITPVRAVDHRRIGSGKPGPITQALQKRFKETVRGQRQEYADWLHTVPIAAPQSR